MSKWILAHSLSRIIKDYGEENLKLGYKGT